jgi:hypothetical protein
MGRVRTPEVRLRMGSVRLVVMIVVFKGAEQVSNFFATPRASSRGM